jgi:hypothetical protein
MNTEFDITPTVMQSSALPPERVRIIRRFEDLPLARIRRGIVYVLAAWSAPSIMHFGRITRALARSDRPNLEFYVLDIDCVPHDFMTATFQHSAAGAGETMWVRDGVVVASVLTYPRGDVEAEFLKRTKESLDE